MEKEELAALDKSSFELDCLQMMMTRCDGSKKHSGAGYIRQSEDGGFDFRLFAPEQLDLRNLSQGRDTQAGQLIHENHMWKLDAVDTQGRTWTAERIWDVGVGGHVDKLTADIEFVPVVRRNLDGKLPVEPVFDFAGG